MYRPNVEKRKLFCLLMAQALLCFVLHGFASADEDSIRCSSALVQIGDSKMEVMNKCGDPDIKDHERWTYDMGEGNFIYLLTFTSDKLVSIEQKGRGGLHPKKP